MMRYFYPKNQSSYRPEIDGIRAVAVSGVVLYHFDFPGLAGGFTGVDVFFVLSGYLIGGILWKEYVSTGRINLIRFFLRRFRRLAPAWTVVATAVFVVGYATLLPDDFRELGKSLIAAMLFIANIQFWRQAGYFDTASTEKPLLHMWSLSLEEQFYIVLPLVLIACMRRPRLALAILGSSALLSLLASIQMTSHDQSAAFFLFPFRAWELLSGVLLAVLRSKYPEPQCGLWGSVAGLIFVITGMAIIQPDEGFPGAWSLIPVSGTLLLIRYGNTQNEVNRLLSSAPMRWLGLISYSLYLWHWPVRIFADFLLGEGRGVIESISLITFSVVLAYATWRWVENPARNTRTLPDKKLILVFTVSSAVILALGIWPYRYDGLPQRWPATIMTHAYASQDFIQDWSRCYTSDTGPFAGIETCPIGPEGPPQFLAWGDSHLRAVKEGLDRAAHEAGTPGLLIWRAGCPPMFGIKKNESAATRAQDYACEKANIQIEAALKAHPFSNVLLVGCWSYYATGAGVGIDVHNRISIDTDWATAVRQTLDTLDRMGTRVHVLRQPPEVPYYKSLDVARALARNEIVPQAQLEVSLENALLREITGLLPFFENTSQLNIIDPWPKFCETSICSALQDGRVLYFDNNHITNYGALQIRDLFKPLLMTYE